jgi:hypothetical protein
MSLTIFPLFQQGHGDVDEVSELLLGESMLMTQLLDALREVGWHLVAFGNHVQFALLLAIEWEPRAFDYSGSREAGQ